MIVKNPLVSDTPKLYKFWDAERNNRQDLLPHKVTTGSNKLGWFFCTHGYSHSFKARISNVAKGTGCSVCKGRQVCRGFNDFESNCTYESYFWDYAKNEDYPWDVAKSKNSTRWFVCEVGHSFEISLNSIHAHGHWCPYCSGQRVLRGYNDLQYTYPVISEYWDYFLNKEIPENVLSSSSKKYWFNCEDGHVFDISLLNAGARGQWCPYCSGSKIWIGHNDLYTTHPNLSAQIDPNTKVDARHISAGSNKSVRWTCPIDSTHSWYAAVNDRALKGSGCPRCRPSRSKAEIELFEWISENTLPEIEVIPNDRNVLPGRFEIDIYIPSLKLGFEYNGNYWHKDKGDPEGRSMWKENTAKNLGVRLITIWEDEWISNKEECITKVEDALQETQISRLTPLPTYGRLR